MSFHRVVAIGASAGGVTALRTLVARLPADFAAPILVVQHIGNRPSILPELLSRSGPLPAVHAEHGEPLAAGRIYVAPPDRHLMVAGGCVVLDLGPKENFARPAIDPLFRSVSLAYGPRSVGVILTGSLDDGTSGMQAISACGGVTIVQEPAACEDPSMPLSAMRYTEIDHALTLESIADLLAGLVRTAPEPRPAPAPVPEALSYEHELPRMQGDPMENLQRIATPSRFVCPECHGSLWRVHDARPPRLRCYTGHAYTLEALRVAQSEGVDAALWTALRALEEKQEILKEMAAALGAGAEALGLMAEADATRDVAYDLRALIARQDDARSAP